MRHSVVEGFEAHAAVVCPAAARRVRQAGTIPIRGLAALTRHRRQRRAARWRGDPEHDPCCRNRQNGCPALAAPIPGAGEAALAEGRCRKPTRGSYQAHEGFTFVPLSRRAPRLRAAWLRRIGGGPHSRPRHGSKPHAGGVRSGVARAGCLSLSPASLSPRWRKLADHRSTWRQSVEITDYNGGGSGLGYEPRLTC